MVLLSAVGIALPTGAPAEQASQPSSPASGQLDVATYHSCAVLVSADVRCWGFNGDGQLGYGNRNTIGDDETPGSVGPLSPVPGRTVTAIATGDFHTCALLDDGSVRCWGYAFDGQLGYGNRDSIGDDEAPGSVGPVDLDPGPGVGRAVAISAGGRHTCAVLDNGDVRCWGLAANGQLGYGNAPTGTRPVNIGDTEKPAMVEPVNLGGGKAIAVSAGGEHTCAILVGGSVRCWGNGQNGRLGYGNTTMIGDDETPGSVAPVSLGQGATAISAGDFHTCAVLNDRSVRCWGNATDGELGYVNTTWIGDDEFPSSVGPVDLDPGPGSGRALAISAGRSHTCAVLEDRNVRCWGLGVYGRLGYGNTKSIGDNEAPGSVGPVDLGAGHTALAVAAGQAHTCARLDDGNVRCWGFADSGLLGYCNKNRIGDDETPGSVGPVALEIPGPPCPRPPEVDTTGGGAPPVTGGAPVGDVVSVVPSVGPAPVAGGGGSSVDPLVTEARRARGLRVCLAAAKRATRRKRDSARRACLKRYGRTPGRVTGLRARAASKDRIVLSFSAPGSDGARPPAARSYVVKQSLSPIRDARAFGRAQTLPSTSFSKAKLTRVGTKVNLTITDLRPKTSYYYAVAARDNVSKRLGPRSPAVKTKTR